MSGEDPSDPPPKSGEEEPGPISGEDPSDPPPKSGEDPSDPPPKSGEEPGSKSGEGPGPKSGEEPGPKSGEESGEESDEDDGYPPNKGGDGDSCFEEGVYVNTWKIYRDTGPQECMEKCKMERFCTVNSIISTD